MADPGKTCFVIAPIGDPDSEDRRRSDQILKYIIHPAAKEAGYDDAIRADKISEPGMITTQVIQHIIEDALVVADLTGRNPNVFYELAIRHALRRPYIQMIQRGERIPFDVAAIRTIEVDHRDLDLAEVARTELVRQMRSMQSSEREIESPISAAVDLDVLRRSGNPERRQLGEILTGLSEVKTALSALEQKMDTRLRAGPWGTSWGTSIRDLVKESHEAAFLEQMRAYEQALKHQLIKSSGEPVGEERNPVKHDRTSPQGTS